MGNVSAKRGRAAAWWRGIARGVRDFHGRWLRHFDPQTCLASVGLVVLVGCFTLVIAPDSGDDGDRSFPTALLPAVVIDAGHGGKDEGARGRSTGIQEKALTLEIALRLERILNGRGFPTVQTRTEDVYLSLAQRAEIANRIKGPAVFVSIHFNQDSDKSSAGIETFYADTKIPPAADWSWVGFFSRSESLDTGEELAAEVQYAVIARTGARDRGIRARHLYVTRHTRIPAVLIEGGFISNTMEAHLLGDDDYASNLAEGIADGIQAWWKARHRAPAPLPLARER